MDAKLSTNIKCAFILQITKVLRSLICHFLIGEQYPKGFMWGFVWLVGFYCSRMRTCTI